MHVRKLVQAGAASHTVSLPKDWVERNALKKGDTIYIDEKSPRELVISLDERKRANKPVREITIEVDKKDIGMIQREVTSAYINNYQTIHLIGKEINDKIKGIREMMQDFVALEIAEQTSTKVTAKDLLNLQEISIEATIRRMDMILRSIIKDSLTSLEGNNVLESIQFRDSDVNRLYFLLYRLIKSALQDPEMAETLKIKPHDALHLWYLAVNIEGIADSGKQLCSLFQHLEKKHDVKSLKSLYTQGEASYIDAMNAFFKKDRKLADAVAARRSSFIKDADTYLEKNKSPQSMELIQEFKDLSSSIANIARLVIDQDPAV